VDQLIITTWLWGQKYTVAHVKKLRSGFNRHLQQSFRFVCFTDTQREPVDGVTFAPFPDLYLTNVKGCFARLRMFDPTFQAWNDLSSGRIVCCDLDTVITGPLDPVFDRPEPFVILQGGNAVNPCPYVGALMMLRGGAYPEVWKNFSLEKASKVPFHEFPDDQGWLWHMIPDAAGWKAGEGGVYVFQKPGWPNKSVELPADARLVTFIGWRKPEKFRSLDWVRKHWVA